MEPISTNALAHLAKMAVNAKILLTASGALASQAILVNCVSIQSTIVHPNPVRMEHHVKLSLMDSNANVDPDLLVRPSNVFFHSLFEIIFQKIRDGLKAFVQTVVNLWLMENIIFCSFLLMLEFFHRFTPHFYQDNVIF